MSARVVTYDGNAREQFHFVTFDSKSASHCAARDQIFGANKGIPKGTIEKVGRTIEILCRNQCALGLIIYTKVLKSIVFENKDYEALIVHALLLKDPVFGGFQGYRERLFQRADELAKNLETQWIRVTVPNLNESVSHCHKKMILLDVQSPSVSSVVLSDLFPCVELISSLKRCKQPPTSELAPEKRKLRRVNAIADEEVVELMARGGS